MLEYKFYVKGIYEQTLKTTLIHFWICKKKLKIVKNIKKSIYLPKKLEVMKIKTKFLLIVVVVCILSCKNDTKTDTPTKLEVDKSFNVIVDMIVKKDDSFQIYYNEDGSQVFAPEKFINVDVKGSNASQEVKFKLPQDVIPANIRFDLGGNKLQNEIKMVNFRMKYYDKTFEAKDSILEFYFGYNTQIKYDKKTSLAKIKPQNGEVYDPIFIAKTNLQEELKKLIK